MHPHHCLRSLIGKAKVLGGLIMFHREIFALSRRPLVQRGGEEQERDEGDTVRTVAKSRMPDHRDRIICTLLCFRQLRPPIPGSGMYLSHASSQPKPGATNCGQNPEASTRLFTRTPPSFTSLSDQSPSSHYPTRDTLHLPSNQHESSRGWRVRSFPPYRSRRA